ncbi:IS3 family transposase [Collinsella tanakaei]|uniref:IS3 family transposase n=1 Tax=Collinsella tanakaei TaxID=626935 RepID=UPI00195A3330|nr:IS3 family transposase [Collinsella tanakaei]
MPRSTYYRMLAHPPRPKAPDPIEPDVLGAFEASRGGYGARRLKVALERAGITASRRRICRIMRENGLASAYSGCAPRGGARPAQPPSADNVLARGFDGHAPRTHVAADLTYVGTVKILAHFLTA